MATLTGEQLKDSYQSLVTIGDSITSDPTSGQLENGKGTPLTAVGIGTNTPTAKLDIVDENVQIRLANSTTGTTASDGTRMYLNGSDLLIVNRESADIQLYTADTERMRIGSGGDISFRDISANDAFYWDASAGSLGIGTTSPAQTLNVVNNGAYQFRLGTPNSAGVYWEMGRDNVSTGDFLISNGTERLRIDSSGNVGIGVSPASKLHVSDSGNTAAFITGSGCTTYIQSVTTETRIGNLSSGGGSIIFAPADAEKARITSDGLTFNGDTATANALDDYEEGTWTPALNSFSLGNGTSTGLYTKIGNLVTIQFSIVLGSTSVMGNVTTISGLPFTSSNFLSGYVDILDSGTKQFSMVASNYTSSANFSIRGLRSDTTYVESFTISATTPMTWTTGDSIIGQLFYRVA